MKSCSCIRLSRHLILGLYLLLPFSLLAGWSAPIDIYSNAVAVAPVVGVDGSGNAVILNQASTNFTDFFTEASQLSQGIVSNQRSFLPVVGNNNNGDINVSVNASGMAVGAWREINTTTFVSSVRSALLVNNVWTVPLVISSPDINVTSLSNSTTNIDASNNALVVWSGFDINTNIHHIQSNRTFLGNWVGVQTIHSSMNTLFPPVISGNSAGQAIALWVDFDAFVLQSAVLNGALWVVNPSLSSDATHRCQPPLAASMNDSGNAVLLWIDNSHEGLNAIQYMAGIYSAPQLIYIPPTGTFISQIAGVLDNQGNAFALWVVQDNSTSTYTLFVSRYTSAGWGTPLVLDAVTGVDANINSLNIKVDANGNALAVWGKVASLTEAAVYYNVFSQLTGSWVPSSLSLSPIGLFVANPSLSMNLSGDATVAWNTISAPVALPASQTVQAVYALDLFPTPQPPLSPLPPQKFSGKQVKNRFVSETEIINILNWRASSDPSVVGYQLFRNHKLIASIPATGPFSYQDRNRSSKKKYTYEIKSINAFGMPSVGLKVTLP